LFLVPHVPSAAATTGGARAMAHLIAGLAARHAVAVLALRLGDEAAEDPILRQRCELFETFAPATGPRGRWARVLRRRVLPLLSTPAWVLAADTSSYRARVRELARDWQPDVVHVFYHVMAQYVPDLHGCAALRILTQYEPGAAAAQDHARAATGMAGLRARLEAGAWARYEHGVLQLFDTIVVLTERDRRALLPWTGSTPVVRIPLGTPDPGVLLNPIGADPPTVLFVGNFTHPPNVDAALWLMGSIFPRISAARPGVRLSIVGPNATAEMRAMAGQHVSLVGRVDAVTPFLDAASVVVAPLRIGGGMRVKVMEALASGKATVATSLAAEGLDVTSGEQLLLADHEDHFAASVVRLLDAPAERQRLGRRAGQWASSLSGWCRAVDAYEELHAALMAARDAG
jgi:glycosyltransferase involved in cell wall biosynthesis